MHFSSLCDLLWNKLLLFTTSIEQLAVIWSAIFTFSLVACTNVFREKGGWKTDDADLEWFRFKPVCIANRKSFLLLNHTQCQTKQEFIESASWISPSAMQPAVIGSIKSMKIACIWRRTRVNNHHTRPKGTLGSFKRRIVNGLLISWISSGLNPWGNCREILSWSSHVHETGIIVDTVDERCCRL